jgi:hypothetical protein
MSFADRVHTQSAYVLFLPTRVNIVRGQRLFFDYCLPNIDKYLTHGMFREGGRREKRRRGEGRGRRGETLEPCLQT